MKRVFISILLITFVFSCKSDKKKNPQNETVNPKLSGFESRLIDLREVDQQFTSQFKVEKFGIQRVNDTIINYVFKLDPSTLEETVNKYSIGIKGFYQESEKPHRASFSPEMRIIKNEKYIVGRNIVKTNYFDSLDVYIYKRKNWKESGRLGTIIIKDILIRD